MILILAKMFFLYFLIHWGILLIILGYRKDAIGMLNFAIPSGSLVILLWLFGVLV